MKPFDPDEVASLARAATQTPLSPETQRLLQRVILERKAYIERRCEPILQQITACLEYDNDPTSLLQLLEREKAAILAEFELQDATTLQDPSPSGLAIAERWKSSRYPL